MKAILIGYGTQATEYARIFKKEKIKISAICVNKKISKKAIKFKKKFSVESIFTDIKTCLKSTDYDCVFVFLPWDKIETKIYDVIKYSKKTIFAEKPIALSYKNLHDIVRFKKKYFNKIFVLYTRRYFDNVKILKNLIKKNKLNYFRLSVAENSENLIFKHGEKMRKNFKFMMTSHWIDLLIYLFKKFKFNVMNINENTQYIHIKKNKITGLVSLHKNINDTLNFECFFDKFTFKMITFERAYFLKKLIKKNYSLIYQTKKTFLEKKNNFKPGLLNFIKDVKKNKVNKFNRINLPKIEEIYFLYKILMRVK